MATRTKPAPDEAEPEKTAETTATDEDKMTIRQVVEEVLSDLLPGKVETETETVVDTGPMTAREEESHTRSIVAEAIQAFKDEFKGVEVAATKETEAEPGKKPTRWIERKLWGVE